MSFTCGTDVTKYLHAWKCDLFLSTEENQVKRVLAGVTSDPLEGIAAGLVYNMISEPVPVQPTIVSSDNFTIVSSDEPILSSDTPWPKDQVRIVFDGDGVLFFKEPKSVISEQSERETEDIPLAKGPMQAFALKLQNVRRALGELNGWRVRTFLVTTSIDASAKRVFSTMKEWGLEIDEIHFLSGLDKTRFLRTMDPAIFFDHSDQHFQSANQHIPAAHVPHSPRTIQATIDAVVLTTPHHTVTSIIFNDTNTEAKHFKNS
ncbi:unnamed protein product [Rotaria sp. Silwood1]|nr:unnamed protein product [Rotaria sp. Silwood1]